jgi:hypothetical protein
MENVARMEDWKGTTYQKIINISHGLRKKPSKDEAFEIIRSFMNLKEENRLNEIREKDLAKLYSFFRHEPLKKNKTLAHWVGQACAPKKEYGRHPALTLIYSDGDTLWGCSGFVLHWIRASKAFPKGFYDPKTLDPVTCESLFPDCRRLLERYNTTTSGSYQIKYKALKIEAHEVDNKETQIVVFEEPFKAYFNLKYVCNVYNGEEAMLWTFTKEREPLFLTSLDYTRNAVIMPLDL